LLLLLICSLVEVVFDDLLEEFALDIDNLPIPVDIPVIDAVLPEAVFTGSEGEIPGAEIG